MTALVVDTNVVLVANGQHTEVSAGCIAACALRLQELMKRGKLVLDEHYRILNEYQHKTKPKTGNRPGDAFVKWALHNNANRLRVDVIAIEQHATRGFHSFPDDPALANFDSSDRKFVAVSNAHPKKPPIMQAADSKWLDWAGPLKTHGLAVEFICQADIERFHTKKFGP